MQAFGGSSPEPAGDLRGYLRPLGQHRVLIAGCGLVAAILVFVAFPSGAPKYESSASVLIGPAIPIRAQAAASTDLQTEADLASSRAVMDIAAVNLFDGRKADEIRDAITVTSDGSSKLIVVSARDTEAKRATLTAQAVADAYIAFRGRQVRDKLAADRAQLEGRAAELQAQIDAKAKELDNASASDQRRIENDRVRLLAEESSIESQLLENSRQSTDVGSVVGPAQVPDTPASNVGAFRRVGVLAALVAGLIGGAVLAYVLDAFDGKVRDPLVLRSLLGRPVLAAVPYIRRYKKTTAPVTIGDHDHPTADAYRRLRSGFAKVAATMERRDSFLVTSMLPNELKSTVTANLATGLVLQGHRVMAVSADLRQPSLHQVLGLNVAGKPTLVNVLRGDCAVGDALVRTRDGLLVVASAASGEGIHLLETANLTRLIEDFKQYCDMVIFDGAPLIVADSLGLASTVAGTILVTSASSPTESVESARAEIESVGGQVVAGVLTLFKPRMARNSPDAYARDYRLRDQYGAHPGGSGWRGLLGRVLRPEPVSRAHSARRSSNGRNGASHTMVSASRRDSGT